MTAYRLFGLMTATLTLFVLFVSSCGSRPVHANFPSNKISLGSLKQYELAYCWRANDAEATIQDPEEKQIDVAISAGDGSNRVLIQKPRNDPSGSFVNMLGCFDNGGQGIKGASHGLAWRPGYEQLTMVSGVDATLTQFRFFSVTDDHRIHDLGDLDIDTELILINPSSIIWSSSGEQFASYAFDDDPNIQSFGQNIYVYEFASRKFQKITNFPDVGNFVRNAAWSEDGKKLAIGYGQPHSGIAIAHLDGSNSYVEVTSTSNASLKDWPYVINNSIDLLVMLFQKRPMALFNSYLAAVSYPAWVEMDGKEKIIFVAANKNQHASLFIVNQDGTDLKELLPENFGIVAMPKLSPNGKKVAFITYPSWDDISIVEINILNLETMEIQQLAALPALKSNENYVGGIDWTPDGRYIAFGSDFGGKSDIYVISSDGTAWVNLTESLPGDAASPAWRP